MNFIKRVVAGPGDRLAVRGGHVILNGKRQKEPFIEPCGGGEACDLPREITRSGRPLLHDGRQPWQLRRQPVLGPRPTKVDHRRSLRHLLASQADRAPLERCAGRAAGGVHGQPAVPLRPRARARASSPAPTRPGAAASPGPLVAAAVLFDYEKLTLADLRSLSALNDSKQHTDGDARDAVPARAAGRDRGGRDLALRARDRRARAAQDQPGGAERHAAARRRSGLPLPLRRLPGAADRASTSARSSAATPRARRSPRRP